ncbi:MAG: aldo/keto reductase [Verrucomicrobiota bacterium]
MNRRKFLSVLSGSSASAPLLASQISGDTAPPPPPTVTLGKTGIRTSRLAMGTGTRGSRMMSNHTRAGFESLVGLMRHAYERGVRFFDLADQYGSHIYFREALRHIPREDVTILTKYQYRFDGENALKLDHEDQKRAALKAFERFRFEMKVDVLDIVLMHNVVTPDWDKDCAGYIDALFEAKEKGIIKAIGMSCHTLEALKRASELDWVEVALTRINQRGIIMDGSLEEVMPVQKRFKERGASVIGMKIFGNGKLVKKRRQCMEFAQKLDYLDAMTIGSETSQQIDDNLRLMAAYPHKHA